MNRRYLLIAVVFVAVLLAACGDNKDSTTTTSSDTTASDASAPMTAELAESALRIRFSGNSMEANKYFCPAEQTTSTDAAAFEGAEIHELSCAVEQDGIAMRCTHRTTMYPGSDRPQELDETLLFRIDNNKLCTGIFGQPE